MTPNDVKIVADNIEDFIEVTDGVSRLRKAILTLAISGKLLAQDKNEGVVEGVRTTAEYGKEFNIPKSWKWFQLNDICTFRYGYTDSAKEIGTARFVRITDMGSDGNLIPDEQRFVDLSPESEKYLLSNGDLLTARIGATFGRTIIFREKYKAVFASYLIRMSFEQDFLLPEYYWVFSKSGLYWNQAHSLVSGSAQPQFNANLIKKIYLPVPPLAEQKRIVKKVEEVMKQLDMLEAKKRERDEVRARLARSAMQSLGIGESKIALENILELVKTPNDLKELEGALLNLALSGRLLPQEDIDESVQLLLEHINEEKKELELIGKTNKTKLVELIDPVHQYFSLPEKWEWINLKEIITFITDYQANGSFKTLRENVKYFKEKEYAILVRLTDLRKGLTDNSNYVYTDKHGYDFLKKSSLHGGEILVANVGAGVGTTLIMPYINYPCTIAPNMFVVNLSKYIDLKYFIYFCNSPVYIQELKRVQKGTGQPKINKSEYVSVMMPLPPYAEQKRIVKKVEEIMVLINQLKTML